jgi:probable nitrogen fixation protein
MSEANEATAVLDDKKLIEASPFLKELVKVMRAQDTYGSWEGKSDADVVGPFIVTKEQRKLIPIIDDPDPDVLWRVELFYNACGLAIERRTSHIAAPTIKINHEGFGRAMLTTGRLIVYSKYHRDIHRFGFDSLPALADAGDKIVAEAFAMIARFPEAANFG